MAYVHTNISVETSLDVVNKQRELVAEALGPDSVYIRMKETLDEYFNEGNLKNPDIAKAVAETIGNMTVAITGQAMNTALQWEAKQKELVLQKEETEYKIDQMKLESQKLEFDRDNAEAVKIYTQARTIREMGQPVIVNGDVASLPDSGKVYQEILGLQKDLELKEVQKVNYGAQTKQVQAQVHKLIADTYVNHGMFTGYTISETGIVGASKQTQAYKTLSEMNKEVAKEQARGYAWNAWANAASSSAGMIGTLVAAEIANETLVNSTLTTWQTAVNKINAIPQVEITI